MLTLMLFVLAPLTLWKLSGAKAPWEGDDVEEVRTPTVRKKTLPGAAGQAILDGSGPAGSETGEPAPRAGPAAPRGGWGRALRRPPPPRGPTGAPPGTPPPLARPPAGKKGGKGGFPWLALLLLAGWCGAAYLAWFVLSNTTTHEGFDPFAILGVPEGITEPELKRVFKKLALAHHPDRNPDNAAAAAETMVMIQKAYNALTDETARENWVKYGHPDGPQAFSLGVALPEWMLNRDKDTAGAVLAVLMLGGILGPMALLLFFIHRGQGPRAGAGAAAAPGADVSRDTMAIFSGQADQQAGRPLGIAPDSSARHMTEIVVGPVPEIMGIATPFRDQAEELALLTGLMKDVVPFAPELRAPHNQKRPLPSHRAHALLAAYMSRRTDLVPAPYARPLADLLRAMPGLAAGAFEIASVPRINPFRYAFNTSTVGAVEFSQSLYSAVPPMLRQLGSWALHAGQRPQEPAGVKVSQCVLQLPGCMEVEVQKNLHAAGLRTADDLLALPDRAARVAALARAGASADDAASAAEMLECLPRVVVTGKLEPGVPELGFVETYMVAVTLRVAIVRPKYFAAGDAPVATGDAVMAQTPHWPGADREEKWCVLASLDDEQLTVNTSPTTQSVVKGVCVAKIPFLESRKWAVAEKAGAQLAFERASAPRLDPSAPGEGGQEISEPRAPTVPEMVASIRADAAARARAAAGDDEGAPGQPVLLRFFAPKGPPADPKLGKAGAMRTRTHRVTIRVMSETWLGCDASLVLEMPVKSNSDAVREQFVEIQRKEQEEMMDTDEEDPYEEYSSDEESTALRGAGEPEDESWMEDNSAPAAPAGGSDDDDGAVEAVGEAGARAGRAAGGKKGRGGKKGKGGRK